MVTRIFDGAIEQLGRGLAFAARRHQVIVRNLANLESPGFQSRDLVFDDFLRPRPASAPDLPEALPDVGGRTPRLVLSGDGAVKPNGNDVHLDRQMARLAENTLFHGALTQVLASQFAALKQAISGRV
jgi:flagellar basal-body rod protein FlgB